MQKERVKKGGFVCLCRTLMFSILTCSFFFDAGMTVLEIALLGIPGGMGWDEPRLAM